jgi:hypothetical protein
LQQLTQIDPMLSQPSCIILIRQCVLQQLSCGYVSLAKWRWQRFAF